MACNTAGFNNNNKRWLSSFSTTERIEVLTVEVEV